MIIVICIATVLAILVGPVFAYFITEDATLTVGVATILAVLAGPVLAVVVTRYVDDYRAARSRKMEIFRTLMRTRRMPVHIDHVSALNLIEVEFIGHEEVVSHWKTYLSMLGEDLPPIEDRDKYEAAVKRRDNQLTKLLSEIAQCLNMRVEQLSILEGNYIPQGWVDDDFEQRLVRRNLLNVLTARAPIIVRPDQAWANSPYPPPPTVEQSKRDTGELHPDPDQPA